MRPNSKKSAVCSSVTAARSRCTASILITRVRKPRTASDLIFEKAPNSRPQLNHLRDPFSIAVTVPGRHQGAPTLEQIAAPVAAFDRTFDAMPERLFDDLMRKARSLVAPIFEARAKTVRHCRGFVADSFKQLGEHALADGVGADRLAIAKTPGLRGHGPRSAPAQWRARPPRAARADPAPGSSCGIAGSPTPAPPHPNGTRHSEPAALHRGAYR